MKKKFSLLLCMICALLLVGCGAANDESAVYGDITGYGVRAGMEATAEYICSLSDEELGQLYNMYVDDKENQMYAEVLKNWMDIRDEAGDFVSFGDFTLDKAGKTITGTLKINNENRETKIVYVINANSQEVTSINMEIVYTLKEIMGKAALNTVMGILTVFVMLVLISLIISLFKFIPQITAAFENRGKKEEVKAVEAAPAAVVETSDVDDLELIAVISAAIAAATGASTDSFVVRSIKRRY